MAAATTDLSLNRFGLGWWMASVGIATGLLPLISSLSGVGKLT